MASRDLGSSSAIAVKLPLWFVQVSLVIAVCAVSSQAWVHASDRFNARLIDATIVADHLFDPGSDKLGTGNVLDRGV